MSTAQRAGSQAIIFMSVSTDRARATLTQGSKTLSCQQGFFLQHKRRKIYISGYTALSFLQCYFQKLLSFVDERLAEVEVCGKETSNNTFFIQLQILCSMLVVGQHYCFIGGDWITKVGFIPLYLSIQNLAVGTLQS